MMKSENAGIERAIDYVFSDKMLLQEALTHSSALAQKKQRVRDYQRLEFLGDRVLGLVISSHLVLHDQDAVEGELSLRLNALVNGETLTEAAEKLHLDQYIIVGSGEKDIRGRGRASILADVFEAIIGAIYLDGGLEAARSFVENALGDLIAAVDQVQKDPKSRLQEYLQGQARGLPAYQIVAQEGPDHAPSFTVQVTTEDGQTASGGGATRREAEREAASVMLKGFEE